MRPILLKGHDGRLTCVRYSKDGDLLFTTCRRGRINLWYSDDGEHIGTFASAGAKSAAACQKNLQVGSTLHTFWEHFVSFLDVFGLVDLSLFLCPFLRARRAR